MGIREKINDKPIIANVAVAIVVVAALVYIYHFLTTDPSAPPTEAFYSVDDGASYFVDEASQVAPFDHDGAVAVKALVFECDGKLFVNHLERVRPESRDEILKTREGERGESAAQQMIANNRQIKRPGDAEWVSVMSGVGQDILMPKCPDGGGGYPRPVAP